MKKWPTFDNNGDLPVGIHQATLTQTLQHFGTGTLQREHLGQRLERIFMLANSTGKVARFIVFGSFVTVKPAPGDVDIFLLMEDAFDVTRVHSEAALVFDQQKAQNTLGANVFWIRKPVIFSNEQEVVEGWQIKRDRSRRGIVEVIHNDSEQSRT